MKKRLILFLALVFSTGLITLHAQTLFTYGEHTVDKKEFIRFYEENNYDKDKYSAESINNYIRMYALYKMKIKEAELLRMDTIPKVRSEIKSLKKQLAKSHMVDSDVMEALLKEVEERYNTEIEIAHLQISTWGNDTAETYRQIHTIYEEIMSHKITFEDAVSRYSDDGYSKPYQGYLGYIRALDVQYAIENAAYRTAPGEVSRPVKSPMGYHIIKVISKRPAKGNINIAQILIRPENSSDPKSVEDARTLSEKVLQELKSGADFEKYVSTYSADHLSNKNKGMLDPFPPGTYQLPFEQVAFNLSKPGEYGDIVQSEYGFHILRYLGREDLPPFESVKKQYAQKLKQDSRIKIAESAVKDKQLAQMGFKEDMSGFNALMDWVMTDTSRVLDLTSKDISSLTGTLFSLRGYQFTQKDFVNYMIDVTGGQIYGRKDESVAQLYDMYKTNSLEEVHLDELYKNNADFRESFNRDRNGVMIFELMNQRIWQRPNEDIDGMLAYYETNKSKYVYQAGFEGYILESESEEAMKKLTPLLTDYENIPEILFEFNAGSAVKVEHIKGKYEYQQMPHLKTDHIQIKKPSDLFKTPNGKSSVIVPEKTFPAGTVKSFSEARAAVVNDYQLYLDEEWSNELMTKYPLSINSKVMNSIKK